MSWSAVELFGSKADEIPMERVEHELQTWPAQLAAADALFLGWSRCSSGEAGRSCGVVTRVRNGLAGAAG